MFLVLLPPFPCDWTGVLASVSLPTPEMLQQGQTLYEGKARCIGCHGQIALRRPLSEQGLFAIIKFGVAGTAHFPFHYLLSDEEILAIVHYQLHRVQTNLKEKG